MNEHPALSRLDPQAAAILLEIAAQPSSALLRSDPRRPVFPPEREVLTPRTTRLSSAERELLAIHRLEVGCLFHQLVGSGCLEKTELWNTRNHDSKGLGIRNSLSSAEVGTLLDGRLDRAKAADLTAKEMHGDLFRSTIIDLIDLRGSHDLLRLAGLAHELVPSPATAINLSAVYLQMGQAEGIARLLASQHSLCRTTPQRWASYLNQGLAYFCCNDWAKSLEQYSRAIVLAPQTSATTSQLVLAILTKDIPCADQALEALPEVPEERISPGDSILRALSTFRRFSHTQLWESVLHQNVRGLPPRIRSSIEAWFSGSSMP